MLHEQRDVAAALAQWRNDDPIHRYAAEQCVGAQGGRFRELRIARHQHEAHVECERRLTADSRCRAIHDGVSDARANAGAQRSAVVEHHCAIALLEEADFARASR